MAYNFPLLICTSIFKFFMAQNIMPCDTFACTCNKEPNCNKEPICNDHDADSLPTEIND